MSLQLYTGNNRIAETINIQDPRDTNYGTGVNREIVIVGVSESVEIS